MTFTDAGPQVDAYERLRFEALDALRAQGIASHSADRVVPMVRSLVDR
jgi:hypothetical protein